MIRIITMLSLLAAVFCQYPRHRAPPPHQNPPPQRPQSYERPPPPTYEEDDRDYRPQTRNNVIHQPAPVHYVNIGAELAGDYKFGYDTGKGDSGQSFREETRLPDGTVQGAYGYVDETGKQRVVKYTAGKEGFKVVNDADEEKKPQPRQSAPRQTYNQPEVHQQAYKQPQQAYRPSNQQTYNPPQETYRPPQEVARVQPVEYAPSSQHTYRAQPAYRADPVPQRSYAPEPQAYAPEPQAYAPEPQAYAPEPQAYAPYRDAIVPPRTRPSSRVGSRYVPEQASRHQNNEEDYDYPDNEITERRLAPIDTSLLNYNIGTSSGGQQ